MAFRRLILVLGTGMFLCALMSIAQNSQSLADVARQARQQKQSQTSSTNPGSAADQQTADPNTTPPVPKAPHVYTNDEIPEHTGPDVPVSPKVPSVEENYKGGKLSAEQWRSQIRQVKNNITALQRQIESIQSSIRFAGGNYDYHVAYNNRQRAKEQQVENLKSQLSQQQKRLEEMQEAARHQGYSSVVYDP